MSRWSGYVGTNKKLKLVKLTDVETGYPVTALGGGESITYQVTTSPIEGEGTVLASGSGTHDTRVPYKGTWYARYTLPATAQVVHLHWTVVYGGNTDYWHDELLVKARGQ